MLKKPFVVTNPQRIIRFTERLSDHCFGFTTYKFTDLTHSHCSLEATIFSKKDAGFYIILIYYERKYNEAAWPSHVVTSHLLSHSALPLSTQDLMSYQHTLLSIMLSV